ncbi:MAG: hypothetical protein E7169_04320 [Firmicutes bacterium]|nr:hypothetical protein [Bacillota bacterium]
MKESISNSYIFSIVIIFVGIIIVLLIGSLSYSKAFKVKTKVISIIEKHREFNNAAKTEIESFLKTSGYTVTRSNNYGSCPNVNGAEAINTTKNYDYCVYRFDTVKGPYYRVTVFISFDFPVLSSYLRIPMSGETRVIYDV